MCGERVSEDMGAEVAWKSGLASVLFEYFPEPNAAEVLPAAAVDKQRGRLTTIKKLAPACAGVAANPLDGGSTDWGRGVLFLLSPCRSDSQIGG